MAVKNDIYNELKELCSPLADAPKTMPYSLPQNYFGSLPEIVLQRTASLDNGDVLATPYSVPDSYFESLPQQVLQQAKQGEQATLKKDKSVNIWLKNIRWAAAAVFIIAVGLGSYNILTPQTLTIRQQLNEIPESALVAYVQDNADDFETETIANNLNTIDRDVEDVNIEDIEYYLDWQ